MGAIFIMRQNWQGPLRDVLADSLGSGYRNARFRPSGTGCINETWEAFGSGIESLFIKSGPTSALGMYQCEQQGLAALRQCETIRVPNVLGCHALEDAAVLVLEFIPLR